MVITIKIKWQNNLITTLLDLSALETGASSLAPEQLDLVELVEIEAGRLPGESDPKRPEQCIPWRPVKAVNGKAERSSASIFNEGKNIPEESLDKVWTRFYRDPEAGYRGSGLGLSIVAQILSMQDLDYGVENMADGVIFYFSIPIVR